MVLAEFASGQRFKAHALGQRGIAEKVSMMSLGPGQPGDADTPVILATYGGLASSVNPSHLERKGRVAGGGPARQAGRAVAGESWGEFDGYAYRPHLRRQFHLSSQTGQAEILAPLYSVARCG